MTFKILTEHLEIKHEKGISMRGTYFKSYSNLKVSLSMSGKTKVLELIMVCEGVLLQKPIISVSFFW
jgi:hypothetical protein